MGKILWSAFAVLSVFTVSATDYYVDAVDGNDAWDGTSATFVSDLKGPKKTIRAAVELANDPDRTEKAVVTVAPGTYGGDASCLWTDVATQRGSVDADASKSYARAPEWQALADEWGLHFRLEVFDEKAKAQNPDLVKKFKIISCPLL